jgi:hypothetical protein
MRRSLALAALALTASGLAVSAPASAMPAHGPHAAAKASSAAKAAKPTCYAGIVGAESNGHIRYDSVKNGKVTDSVRSKVKLGFPVTAWGYYDSTETKAGGRVLRLDATTESGTPRQVSITQAKTGKITSLSSTAFQQKNFTPDLFTEGYGYYAYTVDNGVLKQWTTTRLRSGKLKYASPVKIGSGYDTLTSLMVSNIFRIKGVLKEVAFATTADGGLLELQIPQKKPQKTKVKTLATTGYAGVTELVWSICNDDLTYIWLGAVDPVADVATWTTIKDVTGKPKSTLQGEISGGGSWDLTATY